jgi:hypothetical protein
MSDLSVEDRRLLDDLERRNTYPQLDRRLDGGRRTYTVTVWPPGGMEAVTTSAHPSAGEALAEAVSLVASP